MIRSIAIAAAVVIASVLVVGTARAQESKAPKTVLMSIGSDKEWTFTCYSTASSEECAILAADVQKAYGSIQPAKYRFFSADSLVETPKWKIVCKSGAAECAQAFQRLSPSVWK